MISFIALGQHGRLGNQMFQVAATVAAARRVGTSAVFPRGAKVQSVFKLEDCEFADNIRPKFAYAERSFEFDPSILTVPDFCNIHGYFQSEKNFQDQIDAIRQNFTFKDEIIEKANEKMLKFSDRSCAVHVRRGDYVNLSNFHAYPGDVYYSSSMNIIKSKFSDSEFVVFSDDIEWCKSSKLFSGCRFVEGESDDVELCMMSMCSFHIIANSSFSWWGSKLSRSLMTIAPSIWFGPDGPRNWNDIYCDRWVRV